MVLAVVHSRAQVGIESPAVTVEVHLANGLPNLSIVGLPEAAVKESKDRVRAALLNANFEFPARRITVNLAPADLPKEGGRFDLPIALGILAASGQLPTAELDGYEFLGELALTGKLRPVRGALTAALATRLSKRKLLVPEVYVCSDVSQAQPSAHHEPAAVFRSTPTHREIHNRRVRRWEAAPMPPKCQAQWEGRSARLLLEDRRGRD